MPIYTTYLAFLRKVGYCPLKIFPDSLKSTLIYYVMRDRGNNEVAPSAELLSKFKSGEICWEEYEKLYRHGVGLLMGTPWMEKRANESKAGHHVILVCFEKSAQHCHRRLLAEEIARRFGAEYKGELTDKDLKYKQFLPFSLNG